MARKTIHMACIFVGMIALNNLCLKYVEVSFYQVARSLTIVFNVLFTYLVLQTKTSSTTLCTLAVVILGFYVRVGVCVDFDFDFNFVFCYCHRCPADIPTCVQMGSSGEVHFSMLGTSFGVMSSVFVAMNSIATKTALTAVDGNKFKLSGYVNTTACVLFLPLILIGGEVDVLRQSSELLLSGSFWLLMMIGGVGGFLIGIVCMLQIQVRHPFVLLRFFCVLVFVFFFVVAGLVTLTNSHAFPAPPGDVAADAQHFWHGQSVPANGVGVGVLPEPHDRKQPDGDHARVDGFARVRVRAHSGDAQHQARATRR